MRPPHTTVQGQRPPGERFATPPIVNESFAVAVRAGKKEKTKIARATQRVITAPVRRSAASRLGTSKLRCVRQRNRN